jgi:pimeloyl-ACP methyl ester carboxylesterase
VTAAVPPQAGALPLVLVPALLCDDALFRPTLDALEASGARVDARVMVAPHHDMAANVAEILERAPERFVLAGASYGGAVAVDVALAAPERVAGLWLIGCDPGAHTAASLGLAAGLTAAPDATIGHLAGVLVRPEATEAAAAFRAMAARVGGHVGAAQARALAGRDDAWDRLGTLAMPALLQWGEDDAAIPVDVGRRLAGALPHARLEVLPACGHLPTLERPAETAAAAGGWLAQFGRGG